MTTDTRCIYRYPVNCGYGTNTANVMVQRYSNERYTWQRLDSCNAMYWSKPTWNNPDSYKEEMHFLVSYGVPIMQIVHRSYELGYNKYILHVNEEHWNCSNSTRRHVGRFLKRYNLPVGYSDVKVLMNKAEREKTFQSVLTIDNTCDVFVCPETCDHLQERFDAYVPWYEVV